MGVLFTVLGVERGVCEWTGTLVAAVVVCDGGGVVDGCPGAVGVLVVVVDTVVGVGVDVDGGSVEGEGGLDVAFEEVGPEVWVPVVVPPGVLLPGVVTVGFVSVGGEGGLVVFVVVGGVVRSVVDSVEEGEVD